MTRVDNPKGPGKAIGAVPLVGPEGELVVASNDIAANAIGFNRSMDGVNIWGTPVTVASKQLGFDLGIPAEFS